MPRHARPKTIEHFKEDGSVLNLISFKFSFSNTGSFTTWEVWCNGKERSAHASSGSFGGSIEPGSILKVTFKIWNGSYNFTYDCKSGSVKKEDPAKPSPITGNAIGAATTMEVINIQF